MFKEVLAEVGDILLYKPKRSDLFGNILAWAQAGGSYSHAAVYIGDGRIVESHMNTGVVEKDLNEKWYKDIDVYRYKGHIPTPEMDRIIKWFTDHVGAGYDLPAFPSAFISSVVGKLLGWAGLRKHRPVFNNPAAFFCSELVAAGYDSEKRDLCPQVHYMSCTPSDLGRSKTISRIS